MLEQDRAEHNKIEQSRAEQSRTEQSRAEQTLCDCAMRAEIMSMIGVHMQHNIEELSI